MLSIPMDRHRKIFAPDLRQPYGPQAAHYSGNFARIWAKSRELRRLCCRSLAALGRRAARRCAAAAGHDRLCGIRCAWSVQAGRQPGPATVCGDGSTGSKRRAAIPCCARARKPGAGSRANSGRRDRARFRCRERRPLLAASGKTGPQQIVKVHDPDRTVGVDHNQRGDFRRIENLQGFAG